MAEIVMPILKRSIIMTAFVLLMMVVSEYVNVQSRSNWAGKLQKSTFWQIIVAALLGNIESSPHLVLATLFLQNLLPFSILLAEPRKDFLKAKAINIPAGLEAGLVMIQSGV